MVTEIRKTWIELLGDDSAGCVVDGRFISRRVTPDRFWVLWACETHKHAVEVMRAWRDELTIRAAFVTT